MALKAFVAENTWCGYSVCKDAFETPPFLAPHFRALVNYEAIQQAFLRQLGKLLLFASC